MSNSFIKTIIKGQSMDNSVDKVRMLKGKVGLIIDIFSNDLHKNTESYILELLEGRAYETIEQVQIKLIRHHKTSDEKTRSEVQVFSAFKEMEDWWKDIEHLEGEEGNVN